MQRAEFFFCCSCALLRFSVSEIAKVKAAAPELGHKEAFQRAAANWRELKMHAGGTAAVPADVISKGDAAAVISRPKRAPTQYNEFMKRGEALIRLQS